MRELISAEQIRYIVATLGEVLSLEYARKGIADLTVVPIMDGAMVFCSDLIRQLNGFVRIEVLPLRIKSYEGMQSGALQMGTLPIVKDKHVLIVDDILDTGKTLAAANAELHRAGAASVMAVFLLSKISPDMMNIRIGHYLASDRFVVGYGLDLNGNFRHLPDIREVLQ